MRRTDLMAEEEEITEEPTEGAEGTEGESTEGSETGKEKKPSLLKQAFKETIKDIKGQVKSVFNRKDKAEAKEEKKKVSLKERVSKLKEKLAIKKEVNNIYQTEKKVVIDYNKPLVISTVKKRASKIKKKVPVGVVNTSNRISALKKEIFEDLKNKPMSQVLPKSIELAVLAGKTREADWMGRELLGYTNYLGGRKSVLVDKKKVPEYRKVDAYLEISLQGADQNHVNDELFTPFFCVESVGWLEEKLERCNNENTREIKTTTFLPDELSMIRKYLGDQPVFVRMKASDFKRILTEVKFRIDTFVSSV
jgi:hypothetical protein